MKQRLLDIIVCPYCKGALTCTAFSEVAAEVSEGILTCGCGMWYPIIGGIPRLQSASLMSDFLPEFVEKYEAKLPRSASPYNIKDETMSLKRRTSSRFGFEWATFSEVIEEYEANFLSYINPVEKPFFRGKLVLDAGCGAGRHSYYAAKFGAEVVAMDLSKAAEAAYNNTRQFSKVHVVQADIYNPPFSQEFDYVFCIGVLHHLPDPQRGFEELVRLLKPKSLISIWVYGKKHNFGAIHIYEPIRRVTTRIPSKVLYYLCYLPAAIMELFNMIYRVFNRFGLVRRLAGLIPFRYYSRFPFRTKLNDSFDVFSAPSAKYYSEHEIEDWFAQAGLKDIKVSYRLLDQVEKGIKGLGTSS
jgi:SAM-dependent methyltransferase/uncharacterized protein YbaR (Trm112 family)